MATDQKERTKERITGALEESGFNVVRVNSSMSDQEIEKALKPLADAHEKAIIRPEKQRDLPPKYIGKNEKRYFYRGDKLIANYGFYAKTKEDITLLIEPDGTLRIYRNGGSWLLIYLPELTKQ